MCGAVVGSFAPGILLFGRRRSCLTGHCAGGLHLLSCSVNQWVGCIDSRHRSGGLWTIRSSDLDVCKVTTFTWVVRMLDSVQWIESALRPLPLGLQWLRSRWFRNCLVDTVTNCWHGNHGQHQLYVEHIALARHGFSRTMKTA